MCILYWKNIRDKREEKVEKTRIFAVKKAGSGFQRRTLLLFLIYKTGRAQISFAGIRKQGYDDLALVFGAVG